MQLWVAVVSFETVFLRHLQFDQQGTQYAMFDLLQYEALLSRSSAGSETALLRKREQNERTRKAVVKKIGNGEKYNMS